MVSVGYFFRKCPTDSAIELMWPGVPVTACAIMRPCRSKMPAERSPASRTVVENAVRIMICAYSSTTAMRRFHMIWRWIWARALVSWDMFLNLRHFDIPQPIHHCCPTRADQGGCLVFRNDGRARDAGPWCQAGAVVDRPGGDGSGCGVADELGADRRCLGGEQVFGPWRRDHVIRYGGDDDGVAHDL